MYLILMIIDRNNYSRLTWVTCLYEAAAEHGSGGPDGSACIVIAEAKHNTSKYKTQGKTHIPLLH
jgi:hypothetical protein